MSGVSCGVGFDVGAVGGFGFGFGFGFGRGIVNVNLKPPPLDSVRPSRDSSSSIAVTRAAAPVRSPGQRHQNR
ncbi:hypothetical protein [Burkholderia vietnamiensis]|uniref:hypothetical protein n=1 Tax=Burkholderia vietnamiensis TaxID=60552 RepID=UPI0012DB1D5B|nr:hypothetical protein [Burkholderia vietnamiensis]